MPAYICEVCRFETNKKNDILNHYKNDHEKDYSKIIDLLFKENDHFKNEIKNKQQWINYMEKQQTNILKENWLYFKKIFDSNLPTSKLADIKKLNKAYFKNYIITTFNNAPNFVLSSIKLTDQFINAYDIGIIDGTVNLIFDLYIKDKLPNNLSFWYIEKEFYMIRINNNWIDDNYGTIISESIINDLILRLNNLSIDMNEMIKKEETNLDLFNNIMIDLKNKQIFISKLREFETRKNIMKKLSKMISIQQHILEKTNI